MDIAEILANRNHVSTKEIKKGWSTDRKYYIRSNNGPDLLLRTSPIAEYTRKAMEFDYMKELFLMGLPVSEPLDIKGVKDDLYSLFTWMDGKDMEDVLPRLSQEEQYQLGLESGKILKEIHTIKAPKETEEWESRFQRKISQKIQGYTDCSLKYEKGNLFLEFIEENQHLIKARPSTFQHGDYHVGNMILSDDKKLSIIDFNRWDYGDPWEEFNRIDFTAQLSPIFATGQLNGYFSGKPSPEFFKLLLLYISTNTLSALPWALHFSKAEVRTMIKKAATVLEWYDDMTRIIPSWYDEEAVEKYGI